MSSALPRAARACARTGVRALCAGALAIGLLTSAPAVEAHAATGAANAKHTAANGTVERKRKPHRKPVNRVAKAVGIAAAQKGDPYGYGASGPNRFDCSGLILYSFRKAGFKGVPRTSSGQAGWARHISRGKMKRGDLIFFTGGSGVYHVGVFAGWKHGRRLVLHSPYSGSRVRTEPVWTDSWFGGTLRGR